MGVDILSEFEGIEAHFIETFKNQCLIFIQNGDIPVNKNETLTDKDSRLYVKVIAVGSKPLAELPYNEDTPSHRFRLLEVIIYTKKGEGMKKTRTYENLLWDSYRGRRIQVLNEAYLFNEPNSLESRIQPDNYYSHTWSCSFELLS